MIRKDYPTEQPCKHRPADYVEWLRTVYMPTLSDEDWSKLVARGHPNLTLDGTTLNEKIDAILKGHPFPNEYWSCKITQSKDRMANVMYACAQLDGRITGLWCIYPEEQFTPKQNARQGLNLTIRIPMGYRERFEKLSGESLYTPPGVTLD